MLEIRNITKTYGALRALDNVSITVDDAQIHAVLGENGAGKSTLMGVLSGFVVPDRGEVLIDQTPIPLGNAARIKRLGIEMVHQHFTLVSAFTVVENIALSRMQDRGQASKHRSSMAQQAIELGRELGWELDPHAKAGSLPVGAQQRVEILKALTGNAKVLILDEPTAVLSQDETASLFEVLRKLKAQGRTVILIAHKLREVMSVADQASVLRKGKHIATANVEDVTEKTLAEWMVGGLPASLQIPAIELGAPALQVQDLTIKGDRSEVAVKGVSCSVAKGEILGIGGVDGNGQIELAEALAQVRPSESGEINWQSQPILTSGVKLGYIPQDRQIDGLALTMSVLDNFLIQGHRKPDLRKGPFLRTARIKSWVRRLIDQFNITVEDPQEPAGSLSGGNQQKVVVARTLESLPELLVAVNPTRGLDLQATSYVHQKLLEAKKGGATIVLFSVDLDELALIADRTVFMSSGRFTGTAATSFAGGGS